MDKVFFYPAPAKPIGRLKQKLLHFLNFMYVCFHCSAYTTEPISLDKVAIDL